MHATLKTLPFIIIIVAVIGAGLLAGKFVADQQRPLTPEELAIEQARLEEKQQQKLQKQREKEEARKLAKLKSKAEYQVAKPDFGPLMHVAEITVEYPDNQADTAIGFLDEEAAQSVKKNQDVILYDQQDYVLPLGGEVSDIEVTDDEYKITISLPEGTNTEYLSKDLEILTFKTIASKRLPHSAIQNDSNGETYVWVAYPDTENKTANKIRRLPITVGLTDPYYFEERAHKIEAHDYIVINPDKTLKSDKSYNFDFIELDAPLHSPIKQAWIDYEIYKYNANQADAAIRVAKCRADARRSKALNPNYDKPDIGDSTKSSCGSAIPTNDPTAIFKALTSRDPDVVVPPASPVPTAPSCGTSCSAQ